MHTHQALIRHCGVSLQVEQHGHVVGIVSGIETRDVDQGVAQTISKVLGIQRRFPIVGQVDDIPRIIRGLYDFGVGST